MWERAQHPAAQGFGVKKKKNEQQQQQKKNQVSVWKKRLFDNLNVFLLNRRGLNDMLCKHSIC